MEKNCHLASPVNLRVPYHASLQPRLLRKTVTLESKLVFVSVSMENHFACHFCLLTILAAYLRLVIARRGYYKTDVHITCSATWQKYPTLDNLINLPDQICNSPHYQPYNSYNVSSENLVWDQLIIPKIYFFLYSNHLSGWYCIDIVRRNSVLVTHVS